MCLLQKKEFWNCVILTFQGLIRVCKTNYKGHWLIWPQKFLRKSLFPLRVICGLWGFCCFSCILSSILLKAKIRMKLFSIFGTGFWTLVFRIRMKWWKILFSNCSKKTLIWELEIILSSLCKILFFKGLIGKSSKMKKSNFLIWKSWGMYRFKRILVSLIKIC